MNLYLAHRRVQLSFRINPLWIFAGADFSRRGYPQDWQRQYRGHECLPEISGQVGIVTLLLDALKGFVPVVLALPFARRVCRRYLCSRLYWPLFRDHRPHLSGLAAVSRRKRSSYRSGISWIALAPQGRTGNGHRVCDDGSLIPLHFPGIDHGCGHLPAVGSALARLPRHPADPGIHGGFFLADHRQASPKLSRLFAGTENKFRSGPNERNRRSSVPGAWGTALAIVAGRTGNHHVRLWAHEPEVRESVQSAAKTTSSCRTNHSGNRAS